MTATKAEGDLAARYGALLQGISVPIADVTDQNWPSLQHSCSNQAVSAILSSVHAGRYDGRAGSLVFARQVAACAPGGPEVRAMLGTAYIEARSPDGPTAALVAFASGQISSLEYKQLGREQLGALGAATGNVFTFWTALPALQWAAGECYDNLTKNCLSANLADLLPAGWRLDASGNFAIGDLASVSIADIPTDDASKILLNLIERGLIIRKDIAVRADQQVAERLLLVRKRLLIQSFGRYEDL